MIKNLANTTVAATDQVINMLEERQKCIVKEVIERCKQVTEAQLKDSSEWTSLFCFIVDKGHSLHNLQRTFGFLFDSSVLEYPIEKVINNIETDRGY